MKNINFILVLCLSFILLPLHAQDFSCVGFASQNGGTTGGNSATNIIDVHTVAELEAAIGTEKNGGSTPRIIRVNGTINNGGTAISIKRCANLTIFGADENAFIEQTPLIITSSSNIIIRNIRFTMTGSGGGKDIIEITTTSSDKSQNIWIDHCEFYNETPKASVVDADSSEKNKYDGLLDIKKNSEYITVSWCYFHDHYKSILIGFTADDTYDRKITIHHNRFVRLNSRIPSFRGGTGHIYNNYFEGWLENGKYYGHCVHTREGCNLLVENNYFTKLVKGVYWEPKDATEGFASGMGNYFDSTVESGFTSRAATTPFAPPYSVDQNDAMELPDLLAQYSGVGVITGYDDYGNPNGGGNKAPIVEITSPAAGDTFDAPADVTVSANVSDEDGTIAKVEFYNGNSLAGTLTAAPYTYSFKGLIAGNYSFAVKAYDNEGKFTSRSVSITVVNPSLADGGSLFGANAPAADYFWFNEVNKTVIEALMVDGTFSGEGVTFDPLKEVKKGNGTVVDSHIGAISIAAGKTMVIKLPSCTLFQLYLSRTGSFAGNVYVSSDGVNWGNAFTTLSGKTGALKVDYTERVSSSSAIYVKIENTATGGLNVQGANIRLAGSGNGIITVDEVEKEVIATKYYNLSGMQIRELNDNAVYIQENIYKDGFIERTKLINK